MYLRSHRWIILVTGVLLALLAVAAQGKVVRPSPAYHATFVGNLAAWQHTSPKFGVKGYWTEHIRGVVRLWVRCHCVPAPTAAAPEGQFMLLRGFLFSEDLNANYTGREALPLEQGLTEGWRPRVLIDIQNGTRLEFDHRLVGGDWWEKREVPSTLFANMTVNSVHDAGLLKVHLENWPQYMPISAVACCRQQAIAGEVPLADDASGGKPVTVVLNSPFNQPFPFLSQLLLNHMAYHLCIGVRGYAMYMPPDLRAHFVHEPVTRGLIRRGLFRTFVLEELPLYEGLPYAWQTLLYNHALLAYWGTGHRLFFIDFDEYLALPNPQGTLGDLMKIHHEGAVLFFNRTDLASSTVKDEEALWRTNTGGALGVYDLWSVPKGVRRSEPKCMVDALRTFNMHIHHGHSLDHKEWVVPMSQAILMHIPSVWKQRNITSELQEKPIGTIWLIDKCVKATQHPVFFEGDGTSKARRL